MKQFDLVWIRTDNRDLDVLGQVEGEDPHQQYWIIRPWNKGIIFFEPIVDDIIPHDRYFHPDDGLLIAGDDDITVTVINHEPITWLINQPHLQLVAVLHNLVKVLENQREKLIEGADRLIAFSHIGSHDVMALLDAAEWGSWENHESTAREMLEAADVVDVDLHVRQVIKEADEGHDFLDEDEDIEWKPGMSVVLAETTTLHQTGNPPVTFEAGTIGTIIRDDGFHLFIEMHDERVALPYNAVIPLNITDEAADWLDEDEDEDIDWKPGMPFKLRFPYTRVFSDDSSMEFSRGMVGIIIKVRTDSLQVNIDGVIFVIDIEDAEPI
jgi:hypothetical protein